MKSRGGGVVDISCRKIARSCPKPNMAFWMVVHVKIDVCDAMGANCATAVAEGLAPVLLQEFGGRIGFRIVSNLNPDRLATVSLILCY